MAAVLTAALAWPGYTPASAATTGTAADSAGIRTERSGHWAQASIDRWTGYGVVKGYGDGLFHPDDNITRAEIATIINRLFGYYAKSELSFADVAAGAWYEEELSKAREAGYYTGFPGNLAKAATTITRQDALTLIAKAFSLQKESATTNLGYTDEESISAYAREAVAALNGIVSGYPDGTFRPDQYMTRAELVQVMDRLVAEFYYEPGAEQGGTIEGHVLMNHRDVALKAAAISGNLYLAPGIADGDIQLEGISVQGTTFVSGGGAHSIHIQNARLGDLLVKRAEGKVRLVLSGTTAGDKLVVNTAADIEIEKGSSIAGIIVADGAAGTSLTIAGTVGKITVEAEGVTINGEPITELGGYYVKDGKLQRGTIDNSETESGTGTGADNGAVIGGGSGNPGTSVKQVDLVDAQATAETKSLFDFLQATRGKAVLFGHQHDTTVSIAGKDSEGKTVSDVWNAVGDYPAVFGWDTLSLDGHESPPGVAGDYEASRVGLSNAMKQAHAMGGIVTLSTHPYNFVTGGSFNDTSNTSGATQSVVTRILPGGDKNEAFRAYLDRIANLANQLKDDQGKLIPVLFRPFHEQNGGWFWWGASTTTKSEYVELYRYTVEYLRDVKNVRNFLYVFSPNGPFNGNESEYFTTYPGDEYVDVLGMDQYDNKDNAGSEAFLGGLVKDLKMIALAADRKGKVATLSEYGYSPSGMKTTGNNDTQWFTAIADAIQQDPDARRIAYMLTWANFGEGNNLYVPYKDVAGKGSHELLPDFIDYYDDPYTSFAKELKGGNVYGRKVKTVSEEPFLHIVTPTNIGTVSEAPSMIRAKVLGVHPNQVTYSIGQNGAEVAMTLDADGYYAAPWTPSAALNGKSATITVRAYETDGSVLEQTVQAFVKVREIAVKQLTFDTADSLPAIQNNGTYPDSIQMALAHADAEGNGKLELRLASGLTEADTWQELKLQLTDNGLSGVDLADIKRAKFTALIPVSVGAAASIQAVAMYPEDWSVKYGQDTTRKTLADLPQVIVEGTAYYRYDAVIELSDAAAASRAAGLAVSLVGSGLAASGPISILIDDLGLYNTYNTPILDTGLVDDFESYGGSDDALAAKYPKAGGDDVSVSLSAEQQASGEYGMKLQYSIGTAGYTGVGKSMGTANWSDSNALQLWVRTDAGSAYAKEGQPLKLVIQAMINGTAYEAYPTLEASKSYQLTIPFADFVVAPWSSGGPITKEGLKKVTNVNLYINAMDNGSHAGVLYFDDIRALYDPNTPDLDGPGSESPSTPAGVLYQFKSAADITGWQLEGNTAQASHIAYDEGEQSLSVGFPLVNTGQNPATQAWNEEFELTTNPTGLNLMGLGSVTARVKLSEGSAKARLYLKSGTGWTWVDSGTPAKVDASGYTTLSIVLADAAKVSGVDLRDIKAIGFKIEEIANDGGAAQLHVKEVALTASN